MIKPLKSRLISLSLFIFILFKISYSQSYYPLEIGNIWQYYDIYEPQYNFTTRAITDTVMPNGIEYTLLQSDRMLHDLYFRQSDSVVYRYLHELEIETPIFDFSKITGDTVSIYNTENEKIITTVLYDGFHNIFGSNRKVWWFIEEHLPTTFYIIWEVTDSIGLSYLQFEAGLEWWLEGAVINGTTYGMVTTVEPLGVSFPDKFQLMQNYPNPFNNSTVVVLEAPFTENISLTVSDILGRQVITLFDGVVTPGSYKMIWNGRDKAGFDVPSGLYLCQLQTAIITRSIKIILLR